MYWSTVISVFAAAVSALAASVALVYNTVAFRQQRRALELQLFQDAYKEVLELEEKLYKDYYGASEDQMKNWDSLFLNALERLSFLVNERFIVDKRLPLFFKDALLKWHDEILVKHVKNWQHQSVYPEFKNLCDWLRKN